MNRGQLSLTSNLLKEQISEVGNLFEEWKNCYQELKEKLAFMKKRRKQRFEIVALSVTAS